MKYIPLAAVIIFLAAGGFLIWKNNTTPSVAAVPASTTDTVADNDTQASPRVTARAPRKSSSTLFDPKDVVVGDQYGAFKVVAVDDWYVPPTASYPYAEYSVDFSGTTTITGIFGRAPDIGCYVPLENVPTSSIQRLPTVAANPHISHAVELYVDDVPDAELPSTGDAVEVTIDHYVSANLPRGCGSDSGHVTSFKKIQP